MANNQKNTSNNNFLKQISKKKLVELVNKAQTDPNPLIRATQTGFFNNIKLEALAILKQERKNTPKNSMKKILEQVISTLRQNS